MIDYKEEARQALFQQDWKEVNLIINKAIKDDTVSPDFYELLTRMCRRQGFIFIKHFNLIQYEQRIPTEIEKQEI